MPCVKPSTKKFTAYPSFTIQRKNNEIIFDDYWRVHGSVYYVVCGDGRLLLRDSSRNKGGLFSSRMAFVELSDLQEQHPLHVVFFYLWAFVGVLVLIFSPFFAASFFLFWLIIKRVNK